MTEENEPVDPLGAERRLKLLVDSVADCALFMLDTNGRVSSWNTGAERIKGYSAEEAIGLHYSRFFTTEDRKAGKPEQMLEKSRERGRYEEEGWRVRKDGSRFWANVIIQTMHDDNGALAGYAKMTRDISDKRETQEALEQAKAALFQAQKMEAIGQLAGGVAHDFNNILTVIVGNLDVITQQLPSQHEDLRRIAFSALRAGLRAAHLTKRLLAFGRRQMLAPQTVNMNQLVEETSLVLRRTFGEAIQIETVLADSLWPCYVDSNQIETALLNLALNARDAMPTGGRVTLHTANMRLDDAYATRHQIPAGNYVMVAVTDSGSGIPPENMKKVFEPFFTTKEVGKGSGLGLAQVYGSVKQSGGHVTIYSEVGLGTTVRLYLPRPAAEQELIAAPQTARGQAPRAARNELVLVVEDDASVRDYSELCLRQLGYRVMTAPDGIAALKIIDETPDIALMLTDVGLPGINGAQLAGEALKRRPSLKILFTTGYAGNAVLSGGLLGPERDVLQKPFILDELGTRVQEILAPGATGTKADERRASSTTRTKILVVDDEDDVIETAANALKSAGFLVQTARNGLEALVAIDEDPRIGLLFTDIKMPGIDGFMLADMAKTRRPDLRIIYATGHRDYVDTRPGVRHGNIIDKPYRPAAVAEEIRKALSGGLMSG